MTVSIVPDTLQGALIISVIDFFLSFVIISGIGVVLAFFPMLNRAAGLMAKRPPATGSPAKPAVAEAQTAEAQDDDIAAIAAAVLVVMDGASHHILHIEPSRPAGWVAEGRQSHHGSHRPNR